MTTPKIFNRLKDITTNIETTTEIANSALPKVGGEISGNLNVTGELSGDLTGNASTATKLAKAGIITLQGDATGSVSFDGSDNVSITTTVADDSHNHTIANVDNLQTTLDAKAPLASPTFTGTPTAPTPATTTNTTQIATTAFVQSVVDAKIAAADALPKSENVMS